MREKILLIDSSRHGSEEASRALEAKEYIVSIARNGKLALSQAAQEKPHVIVIDVTSTRFNGKRLCAQLYPKVTAPIIAIISKRMSPLDCADEHIVNPFTTRQLVALIQRMIKTKQPWILKAGELTLDLKKRTIARGGRPKKLRPMELRLLKTFMRRPNQIITRDELMKRVWHTDFTGDTRTLDVHIRWVRQRIEENASNPQFLITVRGQGYRLEV